MSKKKHFVSIVIFILCMIGLYHVRDILDFANWHLGSIFDFASLLILLVMLSWYFLERRLSGDRKKIRWLLAGSVFITCFFHALIPSINVFAYVLIYYFVLFLTFLTTKLLKLSTPISMGVSVATFLLGMWVLAIFNLLIFTKAFIVLIILLGIFYLYFYYKKKPKQVLLDINQFLDWTIVILAILFIVSIVNGFERYVNVWDEYNMWALQAKKIIVSNSIQGCDHPIIMALWSYFVNIFDSFKEPNLYIGHAIFIYIFLMPVFAWVKEKKLYPLLFITMFTFGYLFREVYAFSTLYADFPSAAVFGFGLIAFFQSVFEKKIKYYPIILSAIFLTLLKLQGFVLGTSLLVICCSYLIFNQMDWNKTNIKKNIIQIGKRYLPLMLIPLFLFMGWYLYSKKILLSGSFVSSEIMPPTLSTTLLSDFSFYNLARFINNFFEFLDETIFYSLFDLSVINYLLLVFVLLLFFFYKKDNKISKAIKQSTPFVLGMICFYFFTLLSSASQQPTMDALNLASLGRYLDNFHVGIFMLLIWLYGVVLFREGKINYSILVVSVVLIIMSVPLNKTFSFVLDLDSRYQTREVYYENKNRFDSVLEHTKEGSGVYIIDQEDKLGYLSMCHSLYYLYPRTVNTNGSINWKLSVESTREETAGWGLTTEKLSEWFLDGTFDYLYLYSSTEEVFEELAVFFPDEEMESMMQYQLFEVQTYGNQVRLLPVV